jgi:hypothetical protein
VLCFVAGNEATLRQERLHVQQPNVDVLMKFARFVFWAAAIYGVAVILPLYFNEQNFSTQYPPAITHAEYYYGFAGVTLVWQILFVLIALHPDRHRPIMVFCVLEKLSLIPAFLILNPQGRFPQMWIPAVIIDIILGALFLVAFIKTGNRNRQPRSA